MWGEMYTAPCENSVNISLQVEKKRKHSSLETSNDITESPRRKLSRFKAHQSIIHQARRMTSNTVKSVDDNIDVGTVVQVALSDVDTTKVDPGNLTLVVVEIQNDITSYRLACSEGPMQNLYASSYITVLGKVNADLVGL